MSITVIDNCRKPAYDADTHDRSQRERDKSDGGVVDKKNGSEVVNSINSYYYYSYSLFIN